MSKWKPVPLGMHKVPGPRPRPLEKVYGRLTVLGPAPYYVVMRTGEKIRMAHVRCECGVERDVRVSRLFIGSATSCHKGRCRVDRISRGASSRGLVAHQVAHAGD